MLHFSTDEGSPYLPESGYSSGTTPEISPNQFMSPPSYMSDSAYSGSLASPEAAVAEGGWHFSPGSGYSAGASASPGSHYSPGFLPLAPPGSPVSPRPVYNLPWVLYICIFLFVLLNFKQIFMLFNILSVLKVCF